MFFSILLHFMKRLNVKIKFLRFFITCIDFAQWRAFLESDAGGCAFPRNVTQLFMHKLQLI